MSRKSIIVCILTLIVLLSGLGVAIFVLYSGQSGERESSSTASYDGARSCIAAVPSDAVLVSCFRTAGSACSGALSGFKFTSALSRLIEDGTLASLKRCPMAVSMHYAGKLLPLYIIDVERVSEEAATGLRSLAEEYGMAVFKTGDFMLLSESETLLKSAVRHSDRNVSVADVPGFDSALSSVQGDDVIIISNLHMQKLLPAVFTGAMSRHSSFVEHVSDWVALKVGDADANMLYLSGVLLYDGDSDEFISVLDGCAPAVSQIADILPSYTISAVSLPVRNIQEYVSSYQTFVDSQQKLQSYRTRQNELSKSAGIHPVDFFKALDVKEIATASFVVGSKMEKVNLIHTGSRDASLIFKGNDISSMRESRLSVYSWAYPSFVASVFGKIFSIQDESSFTYHDGWIISGSSAAVNEFVSNGALDYTLSEYMSNAGADGFISKSPVLMISYVSMSEDINQLAKFLKPEILQTVTSMTEEADYAPAVLALTKIKDNIGVTLETGSFSMKKTKAPSHERDTVVVVPQGPFKVTNSATGKINSFYQNAQNSICLRDETGKDLWGVPFAMKICGTAHNVDYFANGKLQIIFGAGSSIYIIDRLGRYVKGFPLDLGRKIVLGPDIYDFSGSRRYNIIVLHDDNTVHMYNLKGKRPQEWKGITAEETIKSLPERLTVGGKDFWVVRTSIQTLIFPFYGGDPLTKFEGNSKIRPDSEVTIIDNTSVQAVSYDGKTRTIKLK